MGPKATANGFHFGAMNVEAAASIGERTIVTIKTDAGIEVEVYCSATGRSLRVFRRGHGELKVARNGA